MFKGFTADEAAEELERIRDKYGDLSPEAVVHESQSEDSLLHGYFCWDDDKAARLYRAQQAQTLIRNIRVVIVNEEVQCNVRAYVNVRPAEGRYRSYMPTTEAVLNDTAYNDLLEQAKGDMESFVSKYSQIEELNAIKALMLKALAE